MTGSLPSPHSAAEEPDAADVAAALGRIPSGLFVVTWRDSDGDRAMLASWVMQAGFVPPMLTVAVAPGRGLLAAVEAGTPFVVNVLAENQRPLLARFGKPAAPGEDVFAGLDIARASGGGPILGDTAAWLACRAVGRAWGGGDDEGDHVVVLARITASGGGGDRPPLVHVRKNGLRY